MAKFILQKGSCDVIMLVRRNLIVLQVRECVFVLAKTHTFLHSRLVGVELRRGMKVAFFGAWLRLRTFLFYRFLVQNKD